MTAAKKAIAPAAPPLMCASAGCPYEARVRVRHRRVERIAGKPNPIHLSCGAWLMLCHSCDDAKNHRENSEYCKAMGLDASAAQRAWCMAQIKRGAEMLRPRATTREPGSDDE